MCSDLNECLVQDTCHQNAHCRNLEGSYVCTCSAGYEGDGKTCRDINECEGPHACHKHATCENSRGSYRCLCLQGYTGDGRLCGETTL